ncbi:MAG: methylmalonyl-CoA carboxyltransferase [Verrucomicrobia bacterium Tous-C9LFEB]|nr:MAG: methylmalonyl-CoA carboxyltransferase [Verrucomicrobia bacterium Tous-C9LFEB]
MPISAAAVDKLRKKREVALNGGGKDKLEERRKKGLMTARDRLDNLYDANTFQERGLHATHNCTGFGMLDKVLPADGVVTGTGYVAGQSVAAFSQDFTVAGGSLGNIHAKKIVNLMDHALKAGMPIIGFMDSGGARIQEGVGSLSGYGQVFFHNVLASGVVPQIAVIAGPCAGGAAYSPALTDFQIMIKKQANMFICGPDVIKAATGQTCTMEEVGSAAAHATISGNIHFVAENDTHAIQIVKQLLTYLPANNLVDPPHKLPPTLSLTKHKSMDALVPEDPKAPLDMQAVIGKLFDPNTFLEVQRDFAKNLIIGFARLKGMVVAIIANQPMVKAGTLDIDASDKAARFIRFANCFNIPIITLVDVPGFLPGLAQERGGIIRHGAKMLFAYSAATVPKITMIIRKAYGGAYLAMCSKDLGADYVFAWPTAEIAVMGAEGAVKVLYRKEITAAADPKAKEAELIADYREKFASPYQAASKALIDDVIEPSETRAALAMALRSLLSKRETRPPKKHGNIPL